MSFVLIEKPRPNVALVTLNRPDRMNSMAFDVMIPLRDALEEVSLDNDTRVVVLTGAGHGFCSGADLEDSGTIQNIANRGASFITAQRSMELLHDVIVGLRRMPTGDRGRERRPSARILPRSCRRHPAGVGARTSALRASTTG
jgi:enoyl-CoA hydratase